MYATTNRLDFDVEKYKASQPGGYRREVASEVYDLLAERIESKYQNVSQDKKHSALNLTLIEFNNEVMSGRLDYYTAQADQEKLKSWLFEKFDSKISSPRRVLPHQRDYKSNRNRFRLRSRASEEIILPDGLSEMEAKAIRIVHGSKEDITVLAQKLGITAIDMLLILESAISKMSATVDGTQKAK